MPRVEKANRTSIVISDETYDLNSFLNSFTGDHLYDKHDNLVLWGDFCEPTDAQKLEYSTKFGFVLKGTDQSKSSKLHGFYIPGSSALQSPIEDLVSFCGKKCYHYFANTRSPADAGFKYSGQKYFLISAHSELSFIDSGVDTGFSISFWIRANNVQGFNINEGGDDASGEPIPAFFEQNRRTSLKLTASRKLRFSVNSDISNYIFCDSVVDPFVGSDWNNITVTYDGSGDSLGLKIYRNGTDITDTRGVAGTYTGMFPGVTPIYFGRGLSLDSYMPAAYRNFQPTTFLAEFSVWNTNLSQENVKAVFNATQTCSIKKNRRASGYTSLSPRVRLRIRDASTGSYPTILRTGDRDFSGGYGVSFDDQNTLVFGEKIIDEFDDAEIPNFQNFTSEVDSRKWQHTLGLQIRREALRVMLGSSTSAGALVFVGSGERYLQTKRKVRNANISFDLIQGPHNISTNILGEGLKLEKGVSFGAHRETLKLQFSVDGLTNWTTIRTFTPEETLVGFYNKNELDVDTGLYQKKYRKSVSVHFSEINAGDNDYYLRFYQQFSARSDKAVWALGRVEISSMNQDIRYPILIDHDTVEGSRVDQKSIATPHTRSDLTAKGRVLSGVSDLMIHFTPGENISPFDESNVVENLEPTNLFHAVGTDPDNVLPGFSTRLADKTKISFMIGDASTSKTIGHTDKASAGATTTLDDNSFDTLRVNPFTGETIGHSCGFRHDMMMIWDNNSNNWVKLPTSPRHRNFTGGSLFTHIENTHLGFGPIDVVATSSDGPNATTPGNKTTQLPKDVLKSYVRPIKTFHFPYDKKYHPGGGRFSVEANSTNGTIPLTNKINKPFVLEKVVVDFKASFEFADSDDNGEHAYGLYQNFKNLADSRASQRFSRGHRVIIPTFFILNQYLEKFEIAQNFRVETAATVSPTLNYTDILETPIHSGTFGADLVTYGQMCLFASSSEGYGIDLEKAVEDGLGRDLNINILEKTGQLSSTPDLNAVSIDSFTDTFRLEFPCRTGPKSAENQRIMFLTGSSGARTSYGLFVSDNAGGRSFKEFERGNRGLLNNIPGFTPGKNYRTFSSRLQSDPIEVLSPNFESVDQSSPYILFPEDNLIFGWQYPVNADFGEVTTLNSDTRKNIMTLLGPMKIHLYGSLIADNKEHHEYGNQPLTSDAVHEIIGAEKPIDKFQIATRGELSGSYIDDNVVFLENFDHATTPDIGIYSDASEERKERIGSTVFSLRAGTDYPSTYTVGNVVFAKRVEKVLGESNQVQRFVNMQDRSRFYLDSLFITGTFYDNSDYGSMQTYYSIPATHLAGHFSEDRSQIKESVRATAKISYTGQPSAGNLVTLVSAKKLSLNYVFVVSGDALAGGGSVTTGHILSEGDEVGGSTLSSGDAKIGGIAVVISSDDADATYAALTDAILGGSGHNGDITVTHADDNNNEGEVDLRQRLAGEIGNTTVVDALANASTTSFTGGVTNLIHKRSKPKYYFNYRHFGHNFDFFEQGRDGITYQTISDPGFTANPTHDDFSDIIGSPVRVRFASSSLVEDSRIKIYTQVSASELASEIRPYNTSSNSTTESPFIDPSITNPPPFRIQNIKFLSSIT